MPSDFPPRPSERAKIAIGIVLAATLAYSLLIAGQILLWFVLVGIAAGIYLAWLLVVAVFRLVDAIERIASAMEARTEAEQSHDSQREDADGDPSAGTAAVDGNTDDRPATDAEDLSDDG